MNKIIFLLFFSLNLFGQTKVQEQIFTVGQLQEDFKFMRSKMELYNTNLYLYTSKPEIDKKFDELYMGITHSMTTTEFYNYITTIQPTIKDGHNYLLPSTELQNYYTNNELYFPLNIIENNGKIYVTQNFSNDTSINVKDEILLINGKNADSVFYHIENRQPRDGNNKLYAKYVSETYFRSYYGFLFGFCKTYNLKLKSQNGEIENKIIDALPLKTIKQRRQELPVKRYDKIDHEKGIYWKINKEKNYVYLFISDWTTKDMKKKYGLSHKKEFAKFFSEITAQQIKSIIIDLRGNQGGDGENAIDFLKYIMPQSFKYFLSVKKYNHSGKLINTAKRLYKTHKPNKAPFAGKILLLTNGGTFSNSSIFSEVIKKYKRGQIVGTETGGCGKILSGGVGNFVFPNTKINLLKVTHQMITTNSNSIYGQGVIPDILIEPTLEQILNNDDIVLKQAIKLCFDK